MFSYCFRVTVCQEILQENTFSQGNISAYGVDGWQHKLYCHLLSSCKVIHRSQNAFLRRFFYVLTESDKHGAHLVGYFSKVCSWVYSGFIYNF